MARVPCPNCKQYGTYFKYGPCPTCGKKWIELAEATSPATGQPASRPCPGGCAGASGSLSSPMKCALCGWEDPGVLKSASFK